MSDVQGDKSAEREAERAKKARQRERARFAERDAGQPWLGLVGEEREQAIRDHFGYGASETRTQAERDMAAERMLANPRVKADLETAEGIWARHGAGAERERQQKFESLRDSLVEAGVKNVPVSFEVDSEARAERAREYAAWREGYLAGRSE